jgi:hypothetical protein
MKWVLNILGVLLLLFGTLWILQGTNILTQGFMAGHIQYAILGVIVDLVGIGMLVFANRRPKAAGSANTAADKR